MKYLLMSLMITVALFTDVEGSYSASNIIPSEEEIEDMSDSIENISLSHPELVWGPIEENPCDSNEDRSFEKGASNGKKTSPQ